MIDKIFLHFGYTGNNIKHIALYSLAMALLVFLLKWLQWEYLITDNSLDVYIALIAVFFTVLGAWIATQLTNPTIQTVILEKKVHLSQPESFRLMETEVKKMNLTNREQEVLVLLVQGCTNAEIGDKLFLSVSTVKTHVSNLFLKMEVKNRIQAVEKANRFKTSRPTL